MKTKRTQIHERLDGAFFWPEKATDGYRFWVHVPVSPSWVASQRLVRQDGRLVIAEIRVLAREELMARVRGFDGAMPIPTGGLNTSLLRSAPIGVHVTVPVVMDWTEAMLRGRPDRDGIVLKVSAETRRFAELVERELGLRVKPAVRARATKRGRPPLDRTFLESIAADYLRWAQDKPIQRIAQKWNAKPATVLSWISKARRPDSDGNRLIPETKQGAATRQFVGDKQPPSRKGKRG